VKLKALLRGLEVVVKGSKEGEITGISADSKTVSPGNLFIAKSPQYIPEALNGGASAIVTDFYDPFIHVPQLIVEKPSRWESILASRYYSYPSRELLTVGITGTKGKTTTSYLIWHLLNSLGKKSGLIGTVETIVGEERKASTLTTHFPIYNQKLLREMVTKGCTAVSLEISSHGLEQNRVGEIEFDLALFTNLYPDHLDYHKTVEEYAAAKQKLFQQLDKSKKKSKRAFFNADNPWTHFMKEGLQTPHWTFGIEQAADVQASDLRFEASRTTFLVTFQGVTHRFSIPLMGRFNVYNALGAIGIGLHLGASLLQISDSLNQFTAVPGRLEPVVNGKGIAVFVDYAHTGEALDNVLGTLREAAPRRILCVFGCGGDRDPLRRSGMAKAAERWADLAIVTSDNPRSESPQAIIEEILRNFSTPAKAIVEPDRVSAIHRAITLAQPGDLVLIAGKGHEKIQIFAHQTIPFDDVLVAKEALQK